MAFLSILRVVALSMASLSQTRWTEAGSPAPGSMSSNKNLCRSIIPLHKCANILLTSHVAWCSEISGSELQMLAAEETVRVRVLYDQPLQNRIV
jgi:hypothetical protein